MKNIVNLGNVATYINGYAFKPSDWAEDGTPIIRIQDLTGNSYQMNRFKGIVDSKYEVNNGDVLISWSASLGVYIWNRGDAVLNQHIFKVVFDKVEVDKDFFVFQVDNLLKRAANQAHGATMRHLTKPVFDALPFYLPDIKTQRLISSKLNLIGRLIEDHHEQLKKLDELIRSRFIEMFGDSTYGSQEIKTQKLKDICEVKSSKRVYQSEQTSTGVPFFRISDLVDKIKGFKFKPSLYISEKQYLEFKRKGLVPSANDVLVTTRGTIGLCYIVQRDDYFYFQDGMISWICTHNSLIHPVFLKMLFMSDNIRKQIDKVMSGSTVSYLSISQLGNLKILLPPMGLQKEYVNFVVSIDKSKYGGTIFLRLLEDIRICCNI